MAEKIRSEKIRYREFQENDTASIADIIREAWNYDKFSSPKTAKKLSLLFLHSCLANQSYTQVALLDDVPVGVIMGKADKVHKCPLKYRVKQVLSLLSLYLSKEGRDVMKTFGSVSRIDKELLKECRQSYQGELSFFAISSQSRGKGIGKHLFQSLINYMDSLDIPRFYLYTDTSCNYGFYDHQGMTRRAQKDTTFYIEHQTAEMSFFLYDY